MTKRLFILLVTIFLIHSCSTDDNDNPSIQADTKWWVLVHPIQGNEGIYLFNETTSEIERKIHLPVDYSQPEAIDYDGNSIWIAGSHSTASILEINPESGEIIDEIEGIQARSLVVLDDYFYISNFNSIDRLDRQGNFEEEIIDTESNVIHDLAYKDQTLYYVLNLNNDPIIKVNLLDNSQETVIEFGTMEISTNLAILDNDLIMVNQFDQIRRINIESGQIVSETDLPIPLEGSITSITPFN